ncbi:DNA cytosine methyltransferase [Streptomyces sp. adm13(2018)]|nr:DNA cytosine methyltransferase [Streptomyces sp. adm13(2018)]
MPDLRIGSLCTGYGGLDAAVQRVFGGSLAWTSDIDEGARRIIAHRTPGVPNLGDLTTTDWAAVEPVDIVTGGYPCQPFSTAGKRKGTQDERHIWPHIADALRVLRPRYAVFENVAGHLRLGFDTVLADLARLGFDAQWCLVRASEVGAPHQRQRLFILATDADTDRREPERRGVFGVVGGTPAAEPRQGNQRQRAGHPTGDRGEAPADAARLGRGEGRPEPARLEGRPGAPLGGSAAPADPHLLVPGDNGELPAGRDALRHGVRADAPRCGSAAAADTDPRGRGADEQHVRPGEPDADWGRFAPAIARWEAVTGRRAPRATDDRNRLSPAFVEWLMGLDAGHVTDVPGLTRTQQLHALGNGVVPQQAEAAIRHLYARATA